MKAFFTRIVERVLRLLFPDSWVNKDTIGAVSGIVVVSLALIGVCAVLSALAGCYGGRLYVEYEHHSSVPDVDDLNTADQIGGCIGFDLGRQGWAPVMDVCLHKELDKSKPVFGSDPVGTIRIQQPILMWGRK